MPTHDVPPTALQRIYHQTRTPHKYGIVLQPPDGTKYDCPSIFRLHDRWYMLHVAITGAIGYETHLATSDDLLHWTPLGTILPFLHDGWDHAQAAGSISLVNPDWNATPTPETFDGKYWLSYLGGGLPGYETDPLAIGLAWTTTPDQPIPWTRLPQNPVLSPWDKDARPFEKKTLYRSNILHDPAASLGRPFVMFYNGKQLGPGTERIGCAVSDDLIHWRRFAPGPLIDNGPRGISGDPQVVRIGDLWVMFYFGHVWRPKAFDTFACSYDLAHWTRWQGPNLIEPSEPWDKTFAHKPWLIHWNGIVYHFYCAVGDHGRTIALATSQPLNS